MSDIRMLEQTGTYFDFMQTLNNFVLKQEAIKEKQKEAELTNKGHNF